MFWTNIYTCKTNTQSKIHKLTSTIEIYLLLIYG